MYRLRSLALVGVLGLASPALAWSAQPQFGSPRDQVGYQEGYERGQRAGVEDFRRGDRYNFSDESDYRHADAGYRGQYGDRERYGEVFRIGFETGYRTGYSGYGSARARAPEWSDGGPRTGYDAAYERGLNDGYEAGLDDARGHRRYDPISEGRYRSADRGYDGRYGSKDAYKNRYRVAFKQGYESAYQDARRYDRSRPGGGGFFGFGPGF